jgi:beta-galactosidase
VNFPKERDRHLRQRHGFDFDWKFKLGDYHGAQAPDWNDEDWRKLDVPHDWSIEGNYDECHPTGRRGGFLPAGAGWYRKTFEMSDEWVGKKVFIEFDGIYMNSDVWVNGFHLGHRPNGYIGFEYDLTPHLRQGANVIAVRVDTTKAPSGRWYTGSGIYRHVWLTVKERVHVEHWGIYATFPDIRQHMAVASVRTTIFNDSSESRRILLVTEFLDGEGHPVGTAETEADIPAKGNSEIPQTLEIPEPRMWSPDDPYLYRMHTFIRKGAHSSEALDHVVTDIGVRYFAIDAATGFSLNGKPIKLQGVCNHHDAGPVGAAVPDQMLDRRLRLLKAMGCNAIRTSHNPMAPEFYVMCNRIGFLVIDEAFDGWGEVKATFDYGLYFRDWWRRDLGDMIRRDRNHPCIILWSIGNEVKDKTDEMTRNIQDFIHELEPTRPVTCGRGEEGILDVQGFNGHGGRPGVLESVHKEHPERKLLLTEEPHTYQTRGFYRTQTWWRDKDQPRFEIPNLTEEEIFYDGSLQYSSSYDNSGVRNSARDSWRRTRSLPYVAGEFRWSGFDYLGESTGWPARMGNKGIIDLCGFPKDHYYFYQSQWTSEPMIHLLPHWTHPGMEGVVIPVWVYTNGDSAELFLNGESLGLRVMDDEMRATWDVPYTPGTLHAITYKNEIEIAGKTVKTASEPAGIRLAADNRELLPNRTDISHVAFEIIDKDGNVAPTADDLITFRWDGPVRHLGFENGDPLDLTPHRIDSRKAFNGMGIGIFQAAGEDGDIRLIAAGVLGDHVFAQAALVTIDVQSVMLRGVGSVSGLAGMQIRYTLDGSEPGGDSALYTGPFVINETCRVRAAIFENGGTLLETEGEFRKGEREKVIDLTHGNRPAQRTEKPIGPFDPEAIGDWISGSQLLRFTEDGRVIRASTAGERKAFVGYWWYDYPDDVFETPDDAGKGEIWWEDGRTSEILMENLSADKLIVRLSGGHRLNFEKS